MDRIDGRVAIVTGAARGIGAATAARLAADGAAVVINDLDAEPAEAVAAEILANGGRAVAHVGNTVDAEQAQSLVDSALSHFGAVDILINNAGTTRDKMFHGMDEDTFDFVLDANLKTAINCTRAVMPTMREKAKAEIAANGRPRHHRKIIFTSSVAALMGNPGQVNYTAAKGGLIAVTKTLARELGPFGINVNAVAPGFIETRLTQAKRDSDDYGIPEQMRQMAQAMIALGRMGTPEDIAAVHAFLASPDSDFVSGVTIPVTGGQIGGM
jgi:3-oxoacyl-[acyl-carrier protein] reductase